MANFERLIRGALASQDASSTEVRQVIYQSSRNALQKIIDNNRSLTVEAVMEQKRQLEASIASIETEYTQPAPIAVAPEPAAEELIPTSEVTPAPTQPVEPEVESEVFANPITIDDKPEEFIAPPVVEEPVAPSATSPTVAVDDPLHEIQQILESTTPNGIPLEPVQPEIVTPVVAKQTAEPAPIANPQPAPANIQPAAAEPAQEVFDQQTLSVDAPEYVEQGSAQPEYYEEQENIPIGFSKRRKTQKRFLWTLIVLLVLGLLAWITYIVVTGVLNGSLFGQNDNNGPKLNPNSISRQAESENYITVIEASDLSSLNASGSGKVEIVNQLNSNMIRVNSVRDALNRAEPAAPMLIQLKPGVLKQISGKRVTVEIFAKSGGGDTAHFAIGCEFGGLTECGRKRFLAGSQPNASVFAFQMDQVSDINQAMYLTLSTDTTSQAAVTGKGDILDIVYIRLSVDN